MRRGIVDDALSSLSWLFSGSRTPKSFRDGEEFEKFVREVLFPKDYYELIHLTANYAQNSKDYVQTSINPDLKLRPRKSKWQFHVECKYRDITNQNEQIYKALKKAGFSDRDLNADEIKKVDKLLGPLQYITLCDESQLRRYKYINESEDVFICLGLYDSIEEDIQTFLIPVDDLLRNSVRIEALDDFAIANNTPVGPYVAYGRIQEKSRYCIRCRKQKQRNTFCFECWQKWAQYNNFLYTEHYCNECGIETSTSAAKPACLTCFKAQPL